MKIGAFMLKMPFDSALRGIGGEYEISRVLGGFGALAYCICANFFVGWGVIIEHREFDVTAYCLAFPGGLAGIIAAAAGSVAWKDRKVAEAKVIERGAAAAPQPDAEMA
jgi:hypothetical protein